MPGSVASGTPYIIKTHIVFDGNNSWVCCLNIYNPTGKITLTFMNYVYISYDSRKKQRLFVVQC